MAFDQFLVPQFIDVESKIIGPITTRQFFIMMVAGMLDFIFYKMFYFTTFIIVALLTTAIFGMIAFFKVNGMPFHYFFLNLVQTLKRPNLRLWGKTEITELPKKEEKKEEEKFTPKEPLVGDKLSSLSLVVNTGGAFREEEIIK
ncbi:MAG: hypothetical protein GF365_01235|nr:hypothetical protein [Candidatus Buchananbacteria bacterium]